MEEKESKIIEFEELKNILPQAPPFLFIDKVIDYEVGKRLTAIKNISINEWYFEGREGPEMVLPETIILEMAAQAGLVLYHVTKIGKSPKRPRYVLGKITGEFFTLAHPGDQLLIEVGANRALDNGGYSSVSVSVDSNKLADVGFFYSVK